MIDPLFPVAPTGVGGGTLPAMSARRVGRTIAWSFDQDIWVSVHSGVVKADPGAPVAGTTLPQQWVRARIIAMVEILKSANAMISDRMLIVLDGLFPQLDRAAHLYGIPVRKVVVSGYIDPEEDRDELVVTQIVNLPTQSALEYWDKMALLVSDWEDRLPDGLKVVATKVAVNLEWNV